MEAAWRPTPQRLIINVAECIAAPPDPMTACALQLAPTSKKMPTTLVHDIGASQGTHDTASWMLPNWSVEFLTLHQLSPESNHAWIPRGDGAGKAASSESTLRRTLENQVARNPSMASLPIRLYDPRTRTSFTLDRSQEPPSYTVISYTWGRWMLKARDHDTLIEGANWRAPANELFSREALDRAVSSIAGESNAWVDVFCIPQSDSDPQKAIEIGKQSAIFRSAERAAVWLGTGGQQVLVEVCSWVPEVIYMISPLVFDFLRDPKEAMRRLQVIGDFAKVLPWASSLWTLQEAALRPDAVFYGTEGECLLHLDSKPPITIKHLRNTMKAIWNELSDEIGRLNSSTGEQSLPSKDNELSEKDNRQMQVNLAFEVTNDVALHDLGTMNAGELLLASKHRKATREHDRVYGIMGAIGVNIPVNYEADASEVMDSFLLKLHEELPVEIQAFFRDGLHRPSVRHWQMDETAQRLTLLRQHEPPTASAFIGISQDNRLLIDKVEYLESASLAELKAYILSSRAVMASDRPVFHQITNVNKDGGEASTSVYLSHLCIMLEGIARLRRICLVHLGGVSGLELRGLHEAYLILTEASTQSMAPELTRLGLVISADRFLNTHTVEGDFSMK